MAVHRLTIFIALLCIGCPQSPVDSPDARLDADTTDPDADAVLDADTDADLNADADAVADADADSPDVIAYPPYVRATLTDGREIAGELVATYDHNIWWDDPSDELTRALFMPAAFAEYPWDRSVTLVSSYDIDALVDESFPSGVETYADFTRSRRFLLDRLPFEGVSYVIAGHERHHLEENGMGDFAYDFELTDDLGRHYHGDGAANEDYLVWEAEVFLPTGGTLVEVVRDAPDNEPGSYSDDAVNNMVGVHLGGAFYLYLLHFREGSIPEWLVTSAALLETIDEGTFIGNVGNSGVSLEPHLHVVLLWWDEMATASAEPRSWSIPLELTNVFTSDSPTGPSRQEDFASPLGGTWVSESSF